MQALYFLFVPIYDLVQHALIRYNFFDKMRVLKTVVEKCGNRYESDQFMFML